MPDSLIGREIVVPGSTSNLGPGFDALGLALQIYLRVRVVGVDDQAPRALRFDFIDGPPPADNYIARGFHALAERLGLGAWPGLHLEVRSEIPMKAGLGSSAAAIVAGLRLCELVSGPRPVDELLSMAAALEGHPDNTSPSLLGGFVTSCVAPDGRVTALASRWPDALSLIVATPAVTLETKQARAALPRTVPFVDAVSNVQRTALMVHALTSPDRAAAHAALREALHDRLHQPYRETLVPGLREALSLEHPSLLGVFLSGAGPSVAAIATGDVEAIAALLGAVYERLGLACSVREIAVHQPRG